MTDDYWASQAPERVLQALRSALGELAQVEELLAEALGYPRGDGGPNDPTGGGWNTGDHTVVTLAMEVRSRMLDSPTESALAITTKLTDLYVQAGRPSFRSLAKKAGTFSHTTANRALQGQIPHGWNTLSAIVTALHGNVDDFRAPWEQCHRLAAQTVHIPAPLLSERVTRLTERIVALEQAVVAMQGTGRGRESNA